MWQWPWGKWWMTLVDNNNDRANRHNDGVDGDGDGDGDGYDNDEDGEGNNERYWSENRG